MRLGGTRLAALIGLTALLATASVAAGATAEQLTLVTDLPEEGERPAALAEQPFRVQLLIQDDAGVPVAHHDVAWNVTWDGEPWYRTTAASGHDYDGVSTLQLALPAAGPFTVTAKVPVDGETLTTHLEGTVVSDGDRDLDQKADVAVSVPRASAGELVPIAYHVEENQSPVPKSAFASVSIIDRSDERTIVRLPTTLAQTPTEVRYRPSANAWQTVQVSAWDPHAALDATPFNGERGEDALSTGASSTAVSVPTSPPTEEPLTNRVDSAGDERYQLHATYDPYTSISTQGRIHLGVVLTDGADPVEGASFSTTLTGPSGETLLATDALSAPTGVTEIVFASKTPGDYTLTTTASIDGWEGEVSHRFSVHAPLTPLAVGPAYATATGLDDIDAGKPTDVSFSLHDEANQPIDHAELELDVVPMSGGDPSVLRHKLHTHGSGMFPVAMTVPDTGPYQVRVDPVDLELTPVTEYNGPDDGTAPVFGIDVDRSQLDEPLEPASTDDRDGVGIPLSTWGIVAALSAAIVASTIRTGRR